MSYPQALARMWVTIFRLSSAAGADHEAAVAQADAETQHHFTAEQWARFTSSKVGKTRRAAHALVDVGHSTWSGYWWGSCTCGWKTPGEPGYWGPLSEDDVLGYFAEHVTSVYGPDDHATAV